MNAKLAEYNNHILTGSTLKIEKVLSIGSFRKMKIISGNSTRSLFLRIFFRILFLRVYYLYPVFEYELMIFFI